MRGREEPPLSEGGSHWRVAEKGVRPTTLGFSGIVGGAVGLKHTRLGYCHAHPSNQLYCSPFTNRFRVTTAVPAVLFAVHVYTPLLLLSTGLMVRTDLLTSSPVMGLPLFLNV